MSVILSNENHCKVCGGLFNGLKTLGTHIVSKHGIDIQTYYDKCLKKDGEGKCLQCGNPTSFINLTEGYSRFCCVSCAKKWQEAHAEETTLECKECGEKITGRSYNIASLAFTRHIKKNHNLTAQQYYDKFMKKEGEGICQVCGKPTKFLKLSTGYQNCCSRECHLKIARESSAKAHEEMQAYREEQVQIIKTEEMIQEEWKKEIARRLAEFEGDRETSYHAESDIQGSFGVETTWLY